MGYMCLGSGTIPPLLQELAANGCTGLLFGDVKIVLEKI